MRECNCCLPFKTYRYHYFSLCIWLQYLFHQHHPHFFPSIIWMDLMILSCCCLLTTPSVNQRGVLLQSPSDTRGSDKNWQKIDRKKSIKRHFCQKSQEEIILISIRLPSPLFWFHFKINTSSPHLFSSVREQSFPFLSPLTFENREKREGKETCATDIVFLSSWSSRCRCTNSLDR